MVTDSAEKSQENKDDCEKASNTKEIPRWNGVTNISCPRLNELFCCQKVAHSVLFYILIFLFVLVFVYILRKLVSLPGGHAKHNSRKPNNDSTATAVYNHSRDSIPKRLPTKWPKIDTITDYLAAHLAETTTSKDKNSGSYNVPGGSGQSYGWSGFYNNPKPKIGSTSTGNLEGLQKNDKDYGTVYPMTPESQGNAREYDNKILETSPSVTNSDSAHASSKFGSDISQWSAWNYPESSGFRKASTDSSFLSNQETSRVENKPSEWSGWENSRNSGFKNTDSNWPTWGNLENTVQEKNQPRSPAWSFSGYSGSHLVEGGRARSQQNSGSQLRSHVPTPMANGGNYGKWDYTSSPWVKWGSSWLPGSGFGWFRAGDQDSKSFYRSQSSSPRNRFYSNEASGKWAYADHVRSTYKDNNNNNPAGQTDDSSNPGYSDYNKATSANTWNPYYNNREINHTEDWGNFNIFNGQNNGVSKMSSNSGGQDYFESSSPSATTNNKRVNEQYQFSPKVAQEETDDRIHRWPLEEGRVEESVNKLSSTSPKRKKSKHRRPFKNKSQQGSIGQIQHKPSRPKRKHKKSNEFHSWRQKKKMNHAKQTQEGNHFKKSKIPHHGVLKSRLRRRKLKVKARVTSKVKGAKVKGKTNQLSAKVSRLKTPLVSKRRRMKTSINKHKSKNSRERFPSYATYKNFIKRNQTSDTLVGKWHRTIHRVKRCKTLSKIKIKGKVQLSRQYLHRKRKYKYTVLSCRYINNEDDENDGTDDIGDESDALRSENQICREFWFITNGKILLRKITKHHSQNTYTVILCKKGSVAGESKVNPIETLGNNDNDDSTNEDDTNVHKKTGNDSHNNNYQDLNADDTDDTDTSKGTGNENSGNENSDRDDDDNDIDDDITDKNKETENKKNKNFDSDDKTVTNKKTGNQGVDDDEKDFDEDDVDNHGSDKKKKLNDDNDFDDDDFDKATDNDNDKENTDAYDSTTDTDDELTNTLSGDDRSANNERNDDSIENDDDLDDIDIDDDEDDVDAKNKNSQHRKNRNSHKGRKLIKNKSKIETPKSSVKKSFIPKRYGTHKVTKKRKHKTTSKTDATYDNSDVYERLLKGLTENDNINDKKPDLAKLVTAISQENLNSKIISKRVNNKKLHPHSRNKKNKRKNVKVKKNQTLSFHATGIKNANNIKSLLQNLLTNSNNLQSHSQVERKQPTPDYGPTKETEEARSETVSTKPSPQTDTKDLLKLLLPNIISKSTSLQTTAVPSPTPQPTKATTHTSDDDLPILNLLNKLGMQSNLKGKVKTALQRLLPSERMKNNLSTDETIDTKSTSAVTTGLKHSQAQQKLLDFNHPQPSSLNSKAQLPGLTKSADNALPSAIPTTIPSQNYLSPLRSPNSSTLTTKSKNAVVAPTPQGPVDETANQLPFGYSAYRSSNTNPYSYQTPTTNVLCFGDSLTSGYYNHGRGKHPYSIRLNQLLNAGGKHLYKIVTRGVVGEMAHGSMAKRLPKILNEGTHFDWVIILGGTNDVAHVKNFGDDEEFTRELISIWSPKIVNDIEKLHGIARRYGARTVILTIPETAYELWPEFQSIRNMRLSVNAALRKYASQVRDTTVLCDLAYKLPRSTLSKELQKFYWNDHIHLNPVGYNRMAEVISQCIQPYLTK